MEVIETRLRRWGNSLGVIIPNETVERSRLKENKSIKLLIASQDSKAILKETFGMFKGKLKKSGQQIKNELRKELY